MQSITLKLITAILIGVLVGVGGYAFVYAKGYSYLSNDPRACANCHVMTGQYDGWIKSSHHSAATCNDCHTPHNILGKYAVKANNGFFHSFYFTTGWYPDNVAITKFDRHLAVLAALEQANTGEIVAGDAERIGGRRPFPLANSVCEALAGRFRWWLC